MDDQWIDLRRQLSAAEKRAAAAERTAAEETTAKEAKAALLDSLAQAARAEKAQNEALSQQLAELQDEIDALRAAANPATSTEKGKAAALAAGEAGSTADGRHFEGPASPGDPNFMNAEMPESGVTEDLPLRSALRPPMRRGSRFILVAAILAALSGWSLAMFPYYESWTQTTPPPDEPLLQATETAAADATQDGPIAAAPESAGPYKATFASNDAPVGAGNGVTNGVTRSLQNDRLARSVRETARIRTQHAALQRRLRTLNASLLEMRAKLETAAEETTTARREAKLAKSALAKATAKNKRALETRTKADLRTEAKLLAEIQTLRRQLVAARQRTTATGGGSIDAE